MCPPFFQVFMRLTKKALVSSFSPPLFIIEEVSERRRSLMKVGLGILAFKITRLRAPHVKRSSPQGG